MNKKIINAWDEILPDAETKERMFVNIGRKYKQAGKQFIFKPTKILAVAAVFVLIVGVLTINAAELKEFFTKLFFVPGIGLTEDATIKYEGLENPVEIQTKDGTFTLRIAAKTTQNGKSDLSLYIETFDKDYPVTIGLTVDGETLVNEFELQSGSDKRGIDVERPSYWYFHNDFPDVSEFILTVCGVETRIILEEQENSFALSKENNGITIGLYKFKNMTDWIGGAVYDKNLDTESWWTNIIFIDWQFYETDGELFNPNQWDILGHKNNLFGFNMDVDIKGLKTDVVIIDYFLKNMYYGNRINENSDAYLVEIPVPADGETIKTDIQLKVGSYTYKITEVRREGDVIYYVDNAGGCPMEGTPEREKAIENQESFILDAVLFPTNLSSTIKEIHGFPEDAKSIERYLHIFTVAQFGDFDIEFE